MSNSEYLNYISSRDNSWDILCDSGITRLPVDPFQITSYLGISVRNYTESPKTLDYIKQKIPNFDGDGFIIVGKSGEPNIFYNDKVNKGRQAFTIMHEVGHIIRGHEPDPDGILSRWNYYNEDVSDQKEIEANIISARILAPACALWGLKLTTAGEIASVTGLSYTASRIRAQRMAVLYRREAKWIKQRGKSCFLQSAKERQLFEQLLPWIMEQSKKK